MARPIATQEQVVILGKTRMKAGACVGGVVPKTCRAVRLLPPGAPCHPLETPFRVGDIWEMYLRPRSRLAPPHVEDCDETGARWIGTHANLPAFINRIACVYEGEPDGLFDGRLRYRATGSGYVGADDPLPEFSVQFWYLPRPLELDRSPDKVRYVMGGGRKFRITHVGFAAPPAVIPAGTLVRVSLARWWENPNEPDEGPVCSLQLSGWF